MELSEEQEDVIRKILAEGIRIERARVLTLIKEDKRDTLTKEEIIGLINVK